MYERNRFCQHEFTDFNQPLGLKLNLENRWVKKASMIPWKEIEEKYSGLFKSATGMPAKPARTALGALLIQRELGFSDRELVEEIRENPYFQYFIGLPGYEDKTPFVPSLLVEFRKRFTEEALAEINEMIIRSNSEKEEEDMDSDCGSVDENKKNEEEKENEGTLILDATCAPQNIKFPQDSELLNEAREDLEKIIERVCADNGEAKPRMYKKNARKDYLNLARCKKKSAKKLRYAIKAQLQYVRRDLGYIQALIAKGYELKKKETDLLETIAKVYEQQKEMYKEKKHSVAERIVSISQPYIRPIVRGKAASPVEFGAKFDLSLDERGLGRIEKLSFEAYNESEVLREAVERYKERTGHYPRRVLADKIYRNRSNLSYCKERGIRLSGPSLGRPKKDVETDRKTEYTDNADRVEVERAFSLAKRRYGLGCVVTRLTETTKSSIALSIIAMNIRRLASLFLSKNLRLVFRLENSFFRYFQNLFFRCKISVSFDSCC